LLFIKKNIGNCNSKSGGYREPGWLKFRGLSVKSLLEYRQL
jgi:hypothetical protein